MPPRPCSCSDCFLEFFRHRAVQHDYRCPECGGEIKCDDGPRPAGGQDGEVAATPGASAAAATTAPASGEAVISGETLTSATDSGGGADRSGIPS